MSEPATFYVRKVAVLGAGVMGAQIAAHLVNAQVETVLFDLPAKEGDPNAIVKKALKTLTKLKPSPLANKDVVKHIQAANYADDLEQLRDCDVIIEAIAERLDWKLDLYNKVAPFLKPDVIFATNTSGLSINKLAEAVPESLRSRFCGIHFFNPPRYMPLVELIPADGTDTGLFADLETFLVSTLGKSVIYAKDTPNFIGNRVGVFSMLAIMHQTQAFGLPFEVADQLTGPVIGRAKSATYRTADVVGLDTMGHVIGNMTDNLPNDPWHPHYQVPAIVSQLVEAGALGQKTKAGFFKKQGKAILTIDPETGEYRTEDQKADASVLAILKIKNPAERFAALRESDHPQAQFMWAIYRDLFHYCAVLLEEIADTARDVDFAIRWGYGWKQGPFETWQAAGWTQIAQWIKEDIAAGKAMSSAELPAWVFDGRDGVHSAEGSYSPAANINKARSDLAVYQRQLFPDPLLGEQFAQGETLFENEGVRLWTQGDQIGILSFKSKMGAVGNAVLEGIMESIKIAEQSLLGLVIWQGGNGYFSAGANLKEIAGVLEQGQFDVVDGVIANFQAATAALRYSSVPTVAAVEGLALRGGCEVQMHCDRTVAALESYIGLVELGVGVIPGGGGCKEMVRRANLDARGDDHFRDLQTYFKAIAMAEVSSSAVEAKEKGFLRESDLVVFNKHEILHVAKTQVKALADAGYRPPLPTQCKVAGRQGVATFQMMLVNMRDGGFISAHDYHLGVELAKVLSGGEVDAGSVVDETWLLRLEREVFVNLVKTEKSQARIAHMLTTGKPLRN